uniref:Uncharacterized protein n=1 Tax=Dromaius novaehollandiae TaxID=8790 RepID=A0A8C4K7P1_DRONO
MLLPMLPKPASWFGYILVPWVRAQVQLVKAGGGLKATGVSMHLSCFSFKDYDILERVAWIVYDSSIICYDTAMDGRATASWDNPQLSLELLSPAAADTATSFCSTRELSKGQSDSNTGRAKAAMEGGA